MILFLGQLMLLQYFLTQDFLASLETFDRLAEAGFSFDANLTFSFQHRDAMREVRLFMVQFLDRRLKHFNLSQSGLFASTFFEEKQLLRQSCDFRLHLSMLLQ